jgi:serine/threonine protein kinase
MEYCKDGDLKKYLKKKEREGLPEAEVIMIMKQIVKGYQ